jgi:hypothetical protein
MPRSTGLARIVVVDAAIKLQRYAATGYDSNSDSKPGGKRWTILDAACAERRHTQHRHTVVNVGGQQEQNKNIWVPVGE